MISAMGLRLNKTDSDCVADWHDIYMDGQRIASRPPELDDASWATLCRHLCGAPPQDRVDFPAPEPDDPGAWTRMDAYIVAGRHKVYDPFNSSTSTQRDVPKPQPRAPLPTLLAKKRKRR